MKEDTNLANIQVCLTFYMQDMQREVLPKFLELGKRVHVALCHRDLIPWLSYSVVDMLSLIVSEISWPISHSHQLATDFSHFLKKSKSKKILELKGSFPS